MPCRELNYASTEQWKDIKAWLVGRENPDAVVEDRVRDIIAQIAGRGDEALAQYTRSFDCPAFTPEMLPVDNTQLSKAMSSVPARDLDIIAEAAANIREFHEGQVQRSWWTTAPDGAVLGQLVRPVDRAGLYVPGGMGGETPLISSLLMNAIPAQVAGVQEIALVSPPRKDGTLNPYILAAAQLLGISEIYCVGSAWAVAALALGTDAIRAVDVIAGPGNIYVTTAKRLLSGKVAIDMIAGPSEICILADASADPAWLAADMLSQAEHDPLASSICITDDLTLPERLIPALQAQLDVLPRNEIAQKSLADWGAVITVPDMDTGVELANLLAPEHLELSLADPWSLVGSIRHAGAIFMGHATAEPVGDYFAGPNHVLPTMGTARFSSALSVETFTKKSSIIATPQAYVAEHGAKIARLARLEGLEAHARSVEIRNK